MKKILYLLFVAGLLSFTLNAQVTNTVTFQADLTDMMASGFDTANGDTLTVEGLNWDEGTVVVVGDRKLLLSSGNIYATTLTITSGATQVAGDSLRYKYRLSPGDGWNDTGWESGDGSYYYLQADGATVTDDARKPLIEKPAPPAGISNIVTFKADLTDLFGSGVGFFDPDIDGIEVRGFWDENGLYSTGADITDGDKVMVRNLDPGVVYETTVTVTASKTGLSAGATTGFKFKTFPDARWSDGGWEGGTPTAFTFEAEGSEVVLEARKPNGVIPQLGPLGKSVDVLFQCYFPEDGLNSKDSSLIPRDEIEFLILKGDNLAIGKWAGNWVAADTLTAGAIACYDNGTNGDLVAGDYIFSRIVTFADTINAGGVTYKFGAQYPGASTVSGSIPLDNSKAVGVNFFFGLTAVDTMVVLYDVWPTVGTPVSVKELGGQVPNEYSLDQNYPNPFNPSTTIRYSLPAASDVSLKIYNVLGSEVANLVNQKQAAGQYEASFNASNFASGIYFYTLETSGVSISKKMMLIK